MWHSRQLLISAALVLVAFTDPTLRVDGAYMVTPTDHFRVAHQEAEACTGVYRSFDKIKWFEVPGPNFHVAGDPEKIGPLLGLWVWPDTIYVSEQWMHSWVPRHEIIHYLLQTSKHDTAVWGERCHAMWGYLAGDQTISGPGRTWTYGQPGPSVWLPGMR